MVKSRMKAFRTNERPTTQAISRSDSSAKLQQKTGKSRILLEATNFRRAFRLCTPPDFYALLFGTSMTIAMTIGIMDFQRTGNTSLLMAICYLAAGHTGIQKVHNLIRGFSSEEAEKEHLQ